MPIGIIGGTGFAEVMADEARETELVETRHGIVEVQVGQLGQVDVAFIPRHGPAGNIPPHAVNYQAHIEALDMLGCRRIIATNAVGSLLDDLTPGCLALPNQFLDFTDGRPRTLFDRPGDEIVNVDVTAPYCPELRKLLAREAEKLGLACRKGLTYVCTEGPRFETPAEIRMFAALGGHLVGMTGVPEVVFARELGLCYASVCIVTNLAAGLSENPLTADEVNAVMDEVRPRLWELLTAVAGAIDTEASCNYCSPA